LESFDVAVHLGGTALLPVLTDLLRQQDNRPVAHAAFLALDRLTLRDASAVLALLQQQRELMQGREAARANFFARADVMDARQREILERYLLDPQLGAQELEVFSGVYPNGNFMISHNLLTANVTPDGRTLRARDREALKTVESWAGDPRFEKIRPQLNRIQNRLREFTHGTAP
jgi:hypothetical protein